MRSKGTPGRGFTLIELMLVIIMGLILAGVALPGAHTLDDQRLGGALRILGADVEFAQARAVANGEVHRILFDLATHSYQIESPPGVLLPEPLKKTPWVRQLGDNAELLVVDFGGSTALVFDASGEPADGGQVTMENGEFQGSVQVAPVTGEVKLTLP